MDSLLACGILGIIICIIIGFYRGAYGCLGAAISGFGYLMILGIVIMIFPGFSRIIDLIIIIAIISAIVKFFRQQ